ncbi:MAG TPA: glycosyltransferase family 4 protein [Deltaproteobacteria bacterium]|nr:glycosyltransferase family 4 protein [Deltaproteobacteria bacterium]HQB38319.1 glycosyltransferase family 4 protein [Deltaproteobacteria bacterium]
MRSGSLVTTSMKIAIVSPYSTGPARGNITTVRRITRHLCALGAEVLELPADTCSHLQMRQKLRSFRPDIIHGFHATYCGATACQLAAETGIPSVVTITGSDINDPQLSAHPNTLQAMQSASAIVCFDRTVAEKVATRFPQAKARTEIIPQAVEQLPVLGACDFGIARDAFVLFLPAALRPVKQVEFPIAALADMARNHDQLRLIIAGGVIDQEYAEQIRCLLKTAPFAEWLGEVPREQMGDLYVRADVVLNCSVYETMPNGLLEAMALGRAVLAADITGNHVLVRPEKTGLLYCGKEDFCRKAEALYVDPEMRRRLGSSARRYVTENFSPQTEAALHLKLYSRLKVESCTPTA